MTVLMRWELTSRTDACVTFVNATALLLLSLAHMLSSWLCAFAFASKFVLATSKNCDDDWYPLVLFTVKSFIKSEFITIHLLTHFKFIFFFQKIYWTRLASRISDLRVEIACTLPLTCYIDDTWLLGWSLGHRSLVVVWSRSWGSISSFEMTRDQLLYSLSCLLNVAAFLSTCGLCTRVRRKLV